MKPRPLYLNGAWRETAASVQVMNPATGQPIAAVCMLERAAVSAAISDAHAAFIQWRQLTALERGRYLLEIASVLEKRTDEIAALISQENGKPLDQSGGEVRMSIDHLRWFAEECRRSYGRNVPSHDRKKRHMVVKSPIGVVGAISPWNFPLVLAVRKIAPALAAGCTVVLKPATATSLCALAFAECVDAAKVPPGVFQVVQGKASEIAAEFLENPLCRKISFTGSTEVGQKLIAGAAAGIKPLSLELGGHAPLLVFEDADLDRAVEGTMIAKFRNSGQSCIAANRIYVQRPIYAAFLERFVAKARALKLGPWDMPGVAVGPVINAAGLAKAIEHVEDATRRGARLLCGGQRVAGDGWFLEPTVVADVPADALCMREETFAPVAAISAFDTEAEAIELANNTPFGLCSYAFTRDIGRVYRLAESLETGTIAINDGAPTASQCPFGGMKQSGWGRELGSEGLDGFLETKHVSIGI
jgi:succinate-semialdehyde dehydrogenase/glutarate-semialdehyde dehydrogenase